MSAFRQPLTSRPAIAGLFCVLAAAPAAALAFDLPATHRKGEMLHPGQYACAEGTTPTSEFDILDGTAYFLRGTTLRAGEFSYDAAAGRIDWKTGPFAVAHISAYNTVRVTDNAGTPLFAERSFTINVSDQAPVLSLSGPGTVQTGDVYTLNLGATDPGTDTISQWDIDWGDGSTETVVGNPASVTHTFGSAANVIVSATATNEDGTFASNNLAVAVSGTKKVVGAKSPAEAALYNKWLAERRLERVQEWLLEHSNPDQVSIRPEYLADDESRRVVVRVTPVG